MPLIVLSLLATFLTYKMFFPHKLAGLPTSLALGFIALIGIVAVAVVSLPASYLFSDRVWEKTPLVSLNVGEQSSGKYFLGAGTHGNKPVFYYYAKKPDGMVMDYWPARQVTIKTTTGRPYMSARCTAFGTSPWMIAWPVNYGHECIGDVKFFVPKNSVASNYISSDK